MHSEVVLSDLVLVFKVEETFQHGTVVDFSSGLRNLLDKEWSAKSLGRKREVNDEMN